MSHYKPYMKYKDSGVEWIGEVPEHWEHRKITHAFECVGSGTTPPTGQDEWYSDAGIPWITTGELRETVITETSKYVTTKALEEFSTLRVYPAGSLAMAMYGATIGRLGILGVPATTNQACCVISGEISLSIRFAYFWFLAFKQQIVDLYAAGGGQPNINQEVIANLRVPAPTMVEQASITLFLDREIARIDSLIANKTRFIELLTERILATVMSAIPSEKTKHVRLTHLCTLIYRPTEQVPDESYVRLGVLNKGRGLFKKTETDSEDMGDSEFFWVEEGDLILSGQFAWEGSVAMAGTEHIGCVVSHRFPIIRGLPGVALTEYLLALLMTKHGDFLLNDSSRGSAGRNRPLNMNHFLKQKIPLVSMDIQHKVARLIRLRKVLIEKSNESIDLLKERHSAIITTAITGQIDLRESA